MYLPHLLETKQEDIATQKTHAATWMALRISHVFLCDLQVAEPTYVLHTTYI